MRILSVGASLVVLAFSPLQTSQAQEGGSLTVTVAIVSRDYSVTPVPLYELVVSADSADSGLVLRTALDGKAATPLSAGTYRVRSLVPAILDGVAYTWDVSAVVAAGRAVSLELTNANAATETSSVVSSPQESEGVVYERVKGSVFRVEAGLARGSGFLVDTLGGVILTNAHVIAGTNDVSVVLDSVTRVPAQILARDEDADIAVLRISQSFCESCLRLPLARKPHVRPGERLVAIGYPLHQEQTLTAGIASSVREGAIISDVNINHGNSGGPLLTLSGQVIAINTFGDFSETGGPGISGSITIDRANSALSAAREAISAMPQAPDSLLPVLPRIQFPLSLLKGIADTASDRTYRKLTNISARDFQVDFATPLSQMVQRVVSEKELARDRRRREEEAGVIGSERYSQLRNIRDWTQYVGSETTPVVSMAVSPKVGETTGSALMRILVSSSARATYKFKGDVRSVALYRNFLPAQPITGGHRPVEAYQDNQWVRLTDVADVGYYLYQPEVFAPDSAGVPPIILFVIEDLKHPDSPTCQELDAGVVARVWNDFEGLYGAVYPDRPFTPAVTKHLPKRSREVRKLVEDCEWYGRVGATEEGNDK